MSEAEAPQSAMAAPPERFTLQVWGATDTGRSREGNEDAIYPANAGTGESSFKASPERIAEKGQLLIVADGVGGAEGGRQASHWAIRVAVERYYDAPGGNPGINLRQAVETANASLHQYLQSVGTRTSGTTMVGAVIHNHRLYYVNVGDSRAYLFRDGELLQLTRDHSLTQMKLDQGLITPVEAENDPERNVITRSLGARPTVDVDLFPPVDLRPGDVVLLCSDGLTDMIADSRIAQLMAGQAPRRAAQRLIDDANRAGGGDNISAVIARVGGGRNGAAAGAALDSGRSAFRKMDSGQQIILAVLALALALVVLVGGGIIAWNLLGGGGDNDAQGTATQNPAATTEQIGAAASPTATITQMLAPLEPSPTATLTPMPAATSTPRPTATPTPTKSSGLLKPPPQATTEPAEPTEELPPPTATNTPESAPPPPHDPPDTPTTAPDR